MPDRDTRQRNDRRPQGDKTQSGANAQISFVSINYDALNETISSVVQVTRGNQPLGNQRVSFLIDDEQVDLNLTSKENGHAVLHSERKLAPGTHKISAQIAAIGLSVNEIFTVSVDAAKALHCPSIVISHSSVYWDSAFHVVLSIRVSQRGGVLPRCQVNIQAVALDVTEFTNDDGEATKLILVPHPSRAKEQFYEVRLSLPDHGVYKNYQLHLERPAVQQPTQLSIMRPTEVSAGNYMEVITVEHRENPETPSVALPGTRVTIVGGGQVKHYTTNEHGQIEAPLCCTTGDTFTTFQIDVSGIDKMHELTLLGARTFSNALFKRIVGVTLVVMTLLSAFNLLGIGAHALYYFAIVAKHTLHAQTVPEYTLGGYATLSVIGFVLLLSATSIMLVVMFGSVIKDAWHRAMWKYHFARASTVLKDDEPSIFHRVVNRVLDKPAAAATAVEVAPVIATPVVREAKPKWNIAELGQWFLLGMHTLEELFERKRR